MAEADQVGCEHLRDTSGYRIEVRGSLTSEWLAWLDGVAVEPAGDTTILSVVLADQVALRGFLSRLWDLNVTVVSMNPMGRRIKASSRRSDDE